MQAMEILLTASVANKNGTSQRAEIRTLQTKRDQCLGPSQIRFRQQLQNFINVIYVAIAYTLLSGTGGQADIVVYKESCSHYAFED
jgi:hypothetical protein